jgi:hypothetical protein
MVGTSKGSGVLNIWDIRKRCFGHVERQKERGVPGIWGVILIMGFQGFEYK